YEGATDLNFYFARNQIQGDLTVECQFLNRIDLPNSKVKSFFKIELVNGRIRPSFQSASVPIEAFIRNQIRTVLVQSPDLQKEIQFVETFVSTVDLSSFKFSPADYTFSG